MRPHALNRPRWSRNGYRFAIGLETGIGRLSFRNLSSWVYSSRWAYRIRALSDRTCPQCSALVTLVILVTRLATNVVQWHAGLFNHARTMVESVQQKMSESEIGIFGRIAAIISENNTAPHSSSRGRAPF